MNKEQIEEMAKKMKQCYEKYGLLNFKWFAEAIYNAGYRKVICDRDNFTDLLNEETKELSLIEKTRKETAKEILSDLLDLHNIVQDINQKTDFYCSIEQLIAEIEIKYDIEVEE